MEPTEWGMKMGLWSSGAMTGGLFMITAGMARPRTGDHTTETALDSVLLGGGAGLAAIGITASAVQGNDKGGKGKK